jgi:hypothetical protein
VVSRPKRKKKADNNQKRKKERKQKAHHMNGTTIYSSMVVLQKIQLQFINQNNGICSHGISTENTITIY